jgi:nitrilase
MIDLETNLRVAVVQAEPALFDAGACLAKALLLLDEAAAAGARLVVFPELFIPGYPYGLTFGYTVGHRTEAGRRIWKRYYDASLLSDGPEIEALARAAARLGVYVSMGYSERDATSATLYNSNILIAPDGRRLNHRKLKPTGAERLVWGDAQRDYFPVMDTPWGPMGALICWESYMPLARTALYRKGVALYLAPNTNDNPEWQHTVRHIALEGRCFVVNADLFFTKASYPPLGSAAEKDALPDIVCRGGSCVIDPYGHAVSDTVWDGEAIVYADLDMQAVPASRMEFDPCGHYARPDVLRLEVDER